MVAGAVVRQVSCKQKCSRRQRRKQIRCRRRRRSRTRSAAAASARSSVTPPRPASGRPTPHPGEPRSSDSGTGGRPGGRTSATPLDQTPRSLWGEWEESAALAHFHSQNNRKSQSFEVWAQLHLHSGSFTEAENIIISKRRRLHCTWTSDKDLMRKVLDHRCQRLRWTPRFPFLPASFGIVVLGTKSYFCTFLKCW